MSEIAILKTGGKQYLVKTGDTLKVEKFEESKKLLEFPDLLSGKKITAKITGQGKHKKVRIFKFHSKARYMRRKGHRQQYMEIKIEKIS